MKVMRPTFALVTAWLALMPVMARPVAGPEESDPEAFDEDIRLAGATDAEPSAEPVPQPSFAVDIPVEMNGAVWAPWDDGRLRTWSVVHIGDSHMQADIATDVVRSQMQYTWGNAGRGLVEPLRLSGTNQPLNYTFASNIAWRPSRFIKATSTGEPLGFTGCSLSAGPARGYIELGTNDLLDWNPFITVTLWADGPVEVTGATDMEGIPISFDLKRVEGGITVTLMRPVTRIKLNVDLTGPVRLYGASLGAGHPGVYYNVIGHNGATARSYNQIAEFASGVARLQPDLLVVSLGTNEAFGGAFSEQEFTAQLDRMVDSLLTAMPGVRLLLTTPQECQRRQRTGSRRRRRTTFSINDNVARAHQAIKQYGRDNGIPVYDWYEAAGGNGSSDKWVGSGLMSSDRIHLTAAGYRLQGQMMGRALIDAITRNPVPPLIFTETPNHGTTD